MQVLNMLSHFLLVLNSSVNFVIYCWKDDKFRAVMLQKLSFLSRPDSQLSGVKQEKPSKPTDNCGEDRRRGPGPSRAETEETTR